MFWGIHDVVLIGALVGDCLFYRLGASESERSDIERSRALFGSLRPPLPSRFVCVWRMSLANARFDWQTCGQVIKIGIPLFLVQGGAFVYDTVANSLFGLFGGERATSYLVTFAVISGYVIYIIMMVAEAFAYGMQPVASFNAGAGAWGQLRQTIKSSLAFEMLTIAALTVVLWITAYPVCALFNPDVAVLAADATRICGVACFLAMPR